MKKILLIQMRRTLKKNLLRYVLLLLMVALTSYLVVSMLGAAESVIFAVPEFQEKNCLEDGEFVTLEPLSDTELRGLCENGVSIEPQYYLDFSVNDSRLRVFQTRESINQIELDEGKLPETDSGIVIEKQYARHHSLRIGDDVAVGGTVFEICGIGSVPDYESPLPFQTDSTVDSRQFGIGFVTAGAFQALNNSGTGMEAVAYQYAYRLNGKITDEELKSAIEAIPFDYHDVSDPYFKQYVEQVMGKADLLLDLFDNPFFENDEDTQNLKKLMEPELHNLQSFTRADQNARIGTSVADVLASRAICLGAGVIVMILLSYTMAVFSVHEIRRERETIGTLYALGVRRWELLWRYILLPALTAAAGCVIGTMLSYTPIGVRLQMAQTCGYYSVPEIPVRIVPYILLYGLAMPPLIAMIVNGSVASRQLKKPALALIRGTSDGFRVRKMRLKGRGFEHRFRIRQVRQEIRFLAVVLVCMLISLLVLFLGIDSYLLSRHMITNAEADTKFSRIYFYKYPEKEVPEGGYEAYAETMTKEFAGYEIDVTLLGIQPDNPFFQTEVKESRSEVEISSAMSEKFGLKTGDVFTLESDSQNQYYAFRVRKIVPCSTALYVFMNIQSMRELMNADDQYYNAVFSGHELAVDPGLLYSTQTRSDILKSSEVFLNQMMPMVYLLIIVSALLFVIVLYLMLNLLIDRSSYDISLMKVFGYRNREVQRLYLSGNFFVLAAGTFLIVPPAKFLIDAMFPALCANLAIGMDISMPARFYFLICGAIILLTLLDLLIITRKIRRVRPAEVLKNKE
jgi:putative ABC transport system permease protein